MKIDGEQFEKLLCALGKVCGELYGIRTAIEETRGSEQKANSEGLK